MTMAPEVPAAQAATTRRQGRWLSYVWKAALVLGIIGIGLWTAIHGVAGVSWLDVFDVLRGVSLFHLLVLTCVWFGGLAIYSLALAAALPGLGVRRSLLLNLSGSAVANVIPLGGAVATALNWKMVRLWGHSNRSFWVFCVLTNVLDVLTKLLLPLAAVVTLAALSFQVPTVLWVTTAVCVGAIALGSIMLAILLRCQIMRRSGRAGRIRGQIVDAVARMRWLVVQQWPRLLGPSIVYVAAQVLLLSLALQAVGLHESVPIVLTAAAVERLGTLIPITPGGAGIAEVGTIAWLVAAGVDPAGAVAGVLLYRVFLIVVDIPVGGVLLGGWAWVHRRSIRVTA